MRVAEKTTKNKHFGSQEYFLFILFCFTGSRRDLQML